MKLLRYLAPVFAASIAALPTIASAQAPVAGSLTYQGDYSNNGTVGGYQVGPYKADLTGFNSQMGVLNNATIANALIWCVDYGHSSSAKDVSDSYFSTAFVSNTGGIAGNGKFEVTRDVASAGTQYLASNYLKAAQLIERFDAGELGTSTAVDVQGTIWRMFGWNGTTGGGSYNQIAVLANYTFTRDWYVLSDNPCQSYAGNGNCAWNGSDPVSNQEFLTSVPRTGKDISTVPEPSTYALMGLGLVSLGLVSRRRRRTALQTA